MTAFAELGVLPELVTAIKDLGWTLPRDIQHEVIPAILGGGDVCLAAETGSGKTGAFSLPIIQIVWETLKKLKKSKGKVIPPETEWNINLVDRDVSLNVDRNASIAESITADSWNGGRANRGVRLSGKYYYEVTILHGNLVRVGWSTFEASYDLGTCPLGFGYGGTGMKANKIFTKYGEPFVTGDVIGCFLDLNGLTMHFSKNGKEFDVAFKVMPLMSYTFSPAFVLKNSQIQINFGQTGFRYPPRNGYVGLTSASSQYIELSPKNFTAERPKSAPLCIIMEPTYELCQQTYNEIVSFSKYFRSPKLKTAIVIGTMTTAELHNLFDTPIDILVCSPSRAVSLMDMKLLNVNYIRFLVLDEADALLEGSNASQVYKVLNKIPRFSSDQNALQMIISSSTLNTIGVHKFSNKSMHSPQYIDLLGNHLLPNTLHQVFCPVDPVADKSWIRLKSKDGNGITTDGVHSKDQVLPGGNTDVTLSEGVKILKGEYVIKAIKKFEMNNCIIFCRTKLDCDNLEKHFKKQGPEWTCVCLYSGRSLEERNKKLETFTSGAVKFLICTDLAARGIDFVGVPFVINYTLPSIDNVTTYVHRVGRVGRADRMGLAISLVATVPEKVWYHTCGCSTCDNTELKSKNGCCIWFNEKEVLTKIEVYTSGTINAVSTDFDIPVNEYDGAVLYGYYKPRKPDDIVSTTKKAALAFSFERDLTILERELQHSYWQLQRP